MPAQHGKLVSYYCVSTDNRAGQGSFAARFCANADDGGDRATENGTPSATKRAAAAPGCATIELNGRCRDTRGYTMKRYHQPTPMRGAELRDAVSRVGSGIRAPKLLNLNANIALAGVNGSGKSNSA